MLMRVNTVSEHVDTSSVGWTETRTGSKHGDMRVKNCLGKANERPRLLDAPPAERATAAAAAANHRRSTRTDGAATMNGRHRPRSGGDSRRCGYVRHVQVV